MKVINTDDRDNIFKVTKSIVKKAVPSFSPEELKNFKVPGQMNRGILEYIYNHYSAEGSKVLDPMCSIGTSMYYGARLKRKVWGIELISNLAQIGRYLLKEQLSGDKYWELREGNIFKVTLPKNVFDLIIFSPPQIMIKRGGYPKGKDQMGNFNLRQEKKYWDKIAKIVKKIKLSLKKKGYLVTLNVNMKRLDGSLYLFPDEMNKTIESFGMKLREETIVNRKNHVNVDNIQYEYIRAYQKR